MLHALCPPDLDPLDLVGMKRCGAPFHMHHALCPMHHALCSMPHAPCPMLIPLAEAASIHTSYPHKEHPSAPDNQ